MDCHKCITPGGHADNREGYICVGVEHSWEISITTFQFCCQSESTLKAKSV